MKKEKKNERLKILRIFNGSKKIKMEKKSI